MRYAQEKSGQKLHLVFELADGTISQPVCGRTVQNYRMTSNWPLAYACKNCLRVSDERLEKIRLDLIKYVDPKFLVH